jgi:O-antigen/teichoic acid export membrane protein
MLSGTTQLTLSSALMRLLSIVTLPILTSLLSPQAYGVAALAGTVISLASVVGLAGIDMSYMRAFHSAQPPSGATVEHYCWRFAIFGGLLASAVSAAALYWFGGTVLGRDPLLTTLVALGVIASVLHTMAQSRALVADRYRAIAVTTVLTGVIVAGASIGIAMWRPDALALLIPMLLGYMLPVLMLGVPPLGRLAKRSPLTREEGLTLARIGVAGVITAPMFWLLTASDRWFLERFHGAEAVGVYSVGYSVAVVGMVLNNSVMSVWQPEAAREYEADPNQARLTLGRLMSRLIAVMAVIWLAVSASGGDIVRWLANERFHGAAAFVPFVAGGVFFYGVLRLANTGLLLVKQLKWAAVWWLVGGVACTLINFALVPDFGGMGAAIAQWLSFVVIALGILHTAQARFRMVLDWNRLGATVVVVVVAGYLLAPPWHTVPPLSLLMKFPVGVMVALAVAWWTAPDWCAQGLQYVRRRAAG